LIGLVIKFAPGQEDELAKNFFMFIVSSGITPIEVRRLAYFSQNNAFPEENIYSVDETDIYAVQKFGRILGPKELKQVESAISWNLGKTLLLCS
jgi:hypothetical protein